MAEGRPAHTGTAPTALAPLTNPFPEKASHAMTNVKATYPPPAATTGDVSVGTVMQDQRGMQWTCRVVQAVRGPLFTPSRVTAMVSPLAMSSEDELAAQGVILTAVTA